MPSTPESDIARLTKRLRASRIINVVLAAATAFLVIVAVAQAQRTDEPRAALPTESSTAAPADDGPTTPLANQVARADADDPLAIGELGAPVTVVHWTDFRCPFCAVFARDTLPAIIEDYVDAGLVRWEVHDIAFFGDDSINAAVAARAAGDQGRFLEFFTALYEAAPESGHPDMPHEKLVEFAREAGVPDLAAFAAALDEVDVRSEVAGDTSAAQQLGVTGVPFFVIGDTVFSGAQPLDAFVTAIDKELAAAGR